PALVRGAVAARPDLLPHGRRPAPARLAPRPVRRAGGRRRRQPVLADRLAVALLDLCALAGGTPRAVAPDAANHLVGARVGRAVRPRPGGGALGRGGGRGRHLERGAPAGAGPAARPGGGRLPGAGAGRA